jgi:accessory gene regulator B
MLIERIAAACRKHNVVSQDQEAVFIYGLDLLLFSVFSIVSFLILGLISGEIRTVLWILAAFIPLQSFSGGYHAESHACCYLTMLVGLIVAIGAMKTLPVVIILLLGILGCIPIFLFAPVEHEKAPFSAAFAAKMRRIARSLACVVIVAGGSLYMFAPQVASSLLLGLAASGVSVSCAMILKRRRKAVPD